MAKQQTEVRSINGTRYRVVPLGGMSALKVSLRLGKVFTAALKAGTFGEGLHQLVSGMTEDDLDWLCQTFSKMTEVEVAEGRWPILTDVFEEHFRGDFVGSLQWLAFCLEVNYVPLVKMLGLSVSPEMKAKALGALNLAPTSGLGQPSAS